jgi:hypothetical protein
MLKRMINIARLRLTRFINSFVRRVSCSKQYFPVHACAVNYRQDGSRAVSVGHDETGQLLVSLVSLVSLVESCESCRVL